LSWSKGSSDHSFHLSPILKHLTALNGKVGYFRSLNIMEALAKDNVPKISEQSMHCFCYAADLSIDPSIKIPLNWLGLTSSY